MKCPLARSHAFRVHVYPRAHTRRYLHHSIYIHVRLSVLSSGPTRAPSRRGVAAPLANIRAVTTRRNHTALARSGATEVGRSTVTAGCTAEAYANRLDFARMAFLFVVKNGACEPRFPRRPTSTRARPCVRFSSRDSRARALRTCSHVTINRVALSSFRSPVRINIRIFSVQVYKYMCIGRYI